MLKKILLTVSLPVLLLSGVQAKDTEYTLIVINIANNSQITKLVTSETKEDCEANKLVFQNLLSGNGKSYNDFQCVQLITD